MNNIVKAVIFSLLGSGVGIAGGYFLAKKKYEKLADKECESLIKKLENQTKEQINPEKKTESKDIKKKKLNDSLIDKKSYDLGATTNKGSVLDYSRIYRSNNDIEEKPEKDLDIDKYVSLITSSEFVQAIDNAQDTLMYYSDGVLSDDSYNEITNVKDYIGNLNLFELFTNTESDAIYIRNSYLKKDFEIIFDERSFKDLVGKYRNLNKDDYDNS